MKIAVFGTTLGRDFVPVLDSFFKYLKDNRIDVHLYGPFYEFLWGDLEFNPYFTSLFHSGADFDNDVSFIFSVGGDGTFLKTFRVVHNFDIPVVGINSGRLGFLADISRDQVIDALAGIFDGKFGIIERTLLKIEFEGSDNFGYNYALNDMTVMKTENSSMINIYAYLNDEFLNNYWGDGLIISTPTGSTAYSLSAGGPIMTPDSENFIITPIAPHNLTVRPIVVPDHNEIVLKTDGRGSHFRISVDSNSLTLGFSTVITIRKADFKLRTLQLPGQTFFNTLRNKLMWGADKRN